MALVMAPSLARNGCGTDEQVDSLTIRLY